MFLYIVGLSKKEKKREKKKKIKEQLVVFVRKYGTKSRNTHIY